MRHSVFNEISLSELRLFAISGLWQNPHLIPEADELSFISNGVAFPIFTAMHNLYEIGQPVTLPNIFAESGFSWDVAYGLAALVDYPISEEQAENYLRYLSNRFEIKEGHYAAA
jgi:hypothetical protein